MDAKPVLASFALDYEHAYIGSALVIHADCLDWMKRIPETSLHAVVTDPPYGVKEYEPEQLEKRSNGNGGLWRIPPAFDGHQRAPLPRFTAFNQTEREEIRRYFEDWAGLLGRVLRPGGHLFIAANALLAQLVFSAIAEGGLEFRGQVVRMVRTMRGGG